MSAVSVPMASVPAQPQPRAAHWPTLDGLRGVAIALVLLYHSEPLLGRMAPVAAWGWMGVSLFFVLSGFLITGLLLDARGKPHYYRNFYARRILRIWPVYVLLLGLQYFLLPLAFSGPHWMLHLVRGAPWWAYLLFIQNLFHLRLPGALGPTWSLAIEEQFYLFWAPLMAWLRPAALTVMALAVVLISPWLRLHGHGLTATNTLFHLDSIAMGALLALGLRRYRNVCARGWQVGALIGIAAGGAGMAIALQRGIPYLDTLLAAGFGGMLVLALAADERPHRNLYGRLLASAPLRFLGRISYGLYMIHILVFSLLPFQGRLAALGGEGAAIVVALRLTASVAAATLLWYGFERPILKLKRYFSTSVAAPRPPAASQSAMARATAGSLSPSSANDASASMPSGACL